MRRLAVVLVAGGLLLTAFPQAALAHSPVTGSSRQYPSSNPVLEWQFANPGYSSWFADPVRAALDESDGDAHWDNQVFNNSNVQNFTLSSGGSGVITYTADDTSPCTGGSEWLMCARNDWNRDGNKSDWKIWIRSLDGRPLYDYKWRDQGYGSSWALVDLERNVLHEAIHIVMMPDAHDPQSPVHTLMTQFSPTDGTEDWDVEHIQECDHARMQMIFGMNSTSDAVAECFDDTSLAMTSTGLATVASLTSPTTACRGQSIQFSGRIRTGTHSEYGQMSTVGLGARTMTVKRNGTVVLTRTTDPDGYFSGTVLAGGAGTYSFNASFAGEGTNALASDASAADSVVVRNC